MRWPLPVPLQFLVRFAVVAGMLFLLRERLAELYLSTMVPTVNGFFSLEELGVVYRQQQHVLLLVYEELGFHFRVHDIIYQNVMVTIALITLFACCMVCHGELVRIKPSADHLTGFYLTIGTGGALGRVSRPP